MKQSTKRIIITTLTVIFLLAACVPAQPSTPDPDDVADQVATSVALTVASQNLETEQAAPAETATPVPTNTPAVVDTPTTVPDVPTATPFVIVPPTTVPGGGGGGTVLKPDYACSIISRRPFDYQVFKPGDDFDVRWTIVNTGTKTMVKGLDLKFSAGDKFISVDRVELPELKPGAQYEVIFDAVAPNKLGRYVMTYIVEGGLCYPYAAISVEK